MAFRKQISHATLYRVGHERVHRIDRLSFSGTAMTTSDLPILYSFRRCPYAMRARLAMAVSQQHCQLREIVLRDKSQAFLDTSPSATVPTLKTHDGTVIDESLDIMTWALALNDPEGWLEPEHGTLDEMMALIEQADGDFKTALDRYKYSTRYEDADGKAERSKASMFLQQLEDRLENSTYLFGQTPTLADMAIAPFVRQFANVDRDWFEGENWPKLLTWLQSFLVSDRFTDIMTKYSRWQPDDPVTTFPSP